MSTVPSESLVAVKDVSAEVFTGTFPSWIVDESDGGTTTAHDASTDGGYWELDPGVGSAGDEARLTTSFGVQPDAYDVVELSSRVSVTTTDERDIAVALGFEGASGDGVTYSYLSPDEDRDDHVRIVADGTTTSYPARRVADTCEHELVLRWFTTDDEVELVTDRFLSATATDVGLDASSPYVPTWRATYQGGDGGQMRVHDATIRYYSQRNP